MSSRKRDKRFFEVARASKLVDGGELARAVEFQEFAASRGKTISLDRILLKFELLTEAQVRSLWLALRYFTWRKEDKFYAKLAVQSAVLSPEDAERCLKEQKRAYREKHVVRRLNEIARDKGLLGPREDLAIVQKMLEVKPRSTIVALAGDVPGRSPDEGSSAIRGPARAGEEEQWRRDMRARELAELSSAARDDDSPAGGSLAELSSDAPLELDLDDDGNPRARLSMSGLDPVPADDPDDSRSGSRSGGSRSRGGRSKGGSSKGGASKGGASKGRGPAESRSGGASSGGLDEDLDPLWDEADLDDIELDSGQAEAARGTRAQGSSSDEDDTDMFG